MRAILPKLHATFWLTTKADCQLLISPFIPHVNGFILDWSPQYYMQQHVVKYQNLRFTDCTDGHISCRLSGSHVFLIRLSRYTTSPHRNSSSTDAAAAAVRWSRGRTKVLTSPPSSGDPIRRLKRGEWKFVTSFRERIYVMLGVTSPVLMESTWHSLARGSTQHSAPADILQPQHADTTSAEHLEVCLLRACKPHVFVFPLRRIYTEIFDFSSFLLRFLATFTGWGC